MTAKNNPKHKFHIENQAQLFIQLFLFVILAFLFMKGFLQVETSGKYNSLAVAGSFLLLFFFWVAREGYQSLFVCFFNI